MHADKRITNLRRMIDDIEETIEWLNCSKFTVNPRPGAIVGGNADLIYHAKQSIATYQALIDRLRVEAGTERNVWKG